MRKSLIPAALMLSVLMTACGSDHAAPDAQSEAPAETLNMEGSAAQVNFVYESKDGGIVITDFIGTETEVVIPSHIDGVPVIEIGQYAFEAAWNVTSIDIPDTVNFIGEQAFLDCESLTSIEIPENVTVLHRATFAGCLALTEITIPAAVTETDEELFIACPLTDLYVENPDLSYVSWGLEELESPCTIHAPEGAEILHWAEKQGFPTEVMKS